jgi:hypothetical protein
MFPNRGTFRRSVVRAGANQLRSQMSHGGGGGGDKVGRIVGYIILALVVLFLLGSVFRGSTHDPVPSAPPKVEKTAVTRPTFDSKLIEVEVGPAVGLYYETLSSNPPHYRCTARIINKTAHSIEKLELADCGSPPQTILGKWLYSSAEVILHPALPPGERREFSYEIKFADYGCTPSKDGPGVNSFTDTSGSTFYNELHYL